MRYLGEHLIRSNGRTVQECRLVSVYWADVAPESVRVERWLSARQHCWQQCALVLIPDIGQRGLSSSLGRRD